MRRLTVLLGAVALVATACGGGGDGSGGGTPMRSSVYFGAVAMTTDRLAIAVDGERVTAFVTDGEPGGDAEWFEGPTAGAGRFDLRSASGNARLEGEVSPAETTGHVTLADGVRRVFHTVPATHGAGIYDVTVSADGHYTGTSTDGSRLDARQAGDYVQGSLTLAGGERHMFRVADLSRVFDHPTRGGQPGRYRLVVARYGLVLMGRGGERLTEGAPDANVIALDLAASAIPTEGIYYGRLDRTIHQLAMSADPVDVTGARRLRVYLSDGLPDGDIEWFTGPVAGGRIDLTSASGRARLAGTFTDDEARGTVTLAGGRQVAFFAVPAGDGAGIYDIEVSADKRYTGSSEKGEQLDLRQVGHTITGSITAPDGRRVDVLSYDLTHVFEYSREGSQPDRYVAFASPGGRYFIGRSGNVRGGSSGNNIIGLDKAC
jgi:hypothetical protein